MTTLGRRLCSPWCTSPWCLGLDEKKHLMYKLRKHLPSISATDDNHNMTDRNLLTKIMMTFQPSSPQSFWGGPRPNPHRHRHSASRCDGMWINFSLYSRIASYSWFCPSTVRFLWGLVHDLNKVLTEVFKYIFLIDRNLLRSHQ